MTIATAPRLTLAVAHYDRFVPLLDGSLRADMLELDVLQVGQSEPGRAGSRRHERMLRDGAFDAAEVSLSSYLMARARNLPFTAIPFFPRRLFSQSQIWINPERGIREARDLIGKRIALSSFQTTLSVLAKGDLQTEYGVPWRGNEWITMRDETVEFAAEPGVVIRRAPPDADLGTMLQNGEVDAVFNPVPPRAALAGAANVRRLFADPKAEETRYFRKNGFYPIMHVVALRNDVVERYPQAPRALYELLLRANTVAETYYDDPNWSRLAWGRLDLEEERALLGADVWPAGIARNRANLERFIGYSHDQGLIPEPLGVESLFVPELAGT